MNDRKYVIAMSKTGTDIYGMPWQSQDVRYVQFSLDEGREGRKLWGEGTKGLKIPIVHKHIHSNPLRATKFDLYEAQVISGILNLILSKSDHVFIVRDLEAISLE